MKATYANSELEEGHEKETRAKQQAVHVDDGSRPPAAVAVLSLEVLRTKNNFRQAIEMGRGFPFLFSCTKNFLGELRGF